MVFWNPKKKRTTAKPKTTASISKPKVGSVKQELNILPQPKKTDNPKPNKVGCMAGFHHNVCLFFIESSG